MPAARQPPFADYDDEETDSDEDIRETYGYDMKVRTDRQTDRHRERHIHRHRQTDTERETRAHTERHALTMVSTECKRNAAVVS